jgi:LAO/AO transport system kinase
MKAGLLEIGDVFIVNKADRSGADELVQLIESVVNLRSYPADEWRPPVVKTVALKNEGVDGLVDLLFQHRRYLESTGRLAERLHRNEIDFFRHVVMDMAEKSLLRESPELCCLQEELVRRAIDPYTAAERVLERTVFRPQPSTMGEKEEERTSTWKSKSEAGKDTAE